MDQPYTGVGPSFYWGVFVPYWFLGVNSSVGHPLLGTIFAIDIDGFLMMQL